MSGCNAEAEEKAGSKQCPQVQVNEYKENGNCAYTSLRPIQTTTSGKTAKAYCLSPFSLSNSKRARFKLSTSPFESHPNNAVACKKTGRKKTCRKGVTSKMKAVSSKAESLLLKPPVDAYTDSELRHSSTAESVTLSVDMGSSDEDSAPGLKYEEKLVVLFGNKMKIF